MSERVEPYRQNEPMIEWSETQQLNTIEWAGPDLWLKRENEQIEQ